MTPKERAAMKQALEALEAEFYDDVKQSKLSKAITALREALDHSGEANEMVGCAYCNNPLFAGTKCNNCGRITLAEQADGEQWSPDDMAYRPSGLSMEQAEQEPFDMDDHPPHRLCECRKCMEYFAPLPDCDAFAASGKPIVEQTNTQLMEGYRIGLAEMREKCAKVCEEIEQDRWNLYKGRPPYTGSESGRADPHEQGVSMGAGECAAAIRAINFKGDTGFRPVSEMIAEHKQDPKKAAAIEKAKMRKADQKPVAFRTMEVRMEPVAWYKHGPYEDGESECCVFIDPKDDDCYSPLGFIDYAAPVRTKDLTDAEIWEIVDNTKPLALDFARAVIAADREKNK